MSECSEVKGLWFATARKYALDSYGTEALEAIARGLSPECREVFHEPIASEWYPEEILQEALAGLRRVLAGNDPVHFVRVMEEAAIVGVNRFISSILGLSNPAFVLKRVPLLWTRIRRGPARVSVIADEAHAVIRYENFPYFADENYIHVTHGSLRALVLMCGATPALRIVSQGRTHLHVEVAWSARST